MPTPPPSRSNAEQARYWTDDGGPSWVRDEAQYDTMLAPFNEALLNVLAPRAGEHILEVGCGFGSTALALAARGAEVHGVDISPPMIERASARAAAAGAAATFAVLDAQDDPLGGPYDAVTSRFGVMFFADPTAAFANFAGATRPGGRLAFVCWQPIARNPWMAVGIGVLRQLLTDPPPPPPPGAGPFAFGEPDFVRAVVTGGGWTLDRIDGFETPVSLGGDAGVEGAVAQALSNSQAKALLAAAGDPTLKERASLILRERFAPEAADGVVRYPAAVWLVTAHRA